MNESFDVVCQNTDMEHIDIDKENRIGFYKFYVVWVDEGQSW